MIVSPFVLDRNVHLIGPLRGGQIGADGDEQEGAGKSGSSGAGAQQAAAGDRRMPADGCELSAGETTMEAFSGGRRRRAEASQRRATIKSCTGREVSGPGAAVGAREGWGGGWGGRVGDAGGGEAGGRGWVGGRCGDAAAL